MYFLCSMIIHRFDATLPATQYILVLSITFLTYICKFLIIFIHIVIVQLTVLDAMKGISLQHNILLCDICTRWLDRSYSINGQTDGMLQCIGIINGHERNGDNEWSPLEIRPRETDTAIWQWMTCLHTN